MILIFELIYSLLPIGGENVAIMTMESLGNLKIHQYVCFKVGNRGGNRVFVFFWGRKYIWERAVVYIRCWNWGGRYQRRAGSILYSVEPLAFLCAQHITGAVKIEHNSRTKGMKIVKTNNCFKNEIGLDWHGPSRRCHMGEHWAADVVTVKGRV